MLIRELKKEEKINKKFQEDEEIIENEEERKRMEEEKKKRREEKIRKIRERQKEKGLNTTHKVKVKNTSEKLFKEQYLQLTKEDEKKSIKNNKLTFKQKKSFRENHNILKILRSNIMRNTGRYLMLFYDHGLTLNILYNSIRR